jgi:hypothetical protein
MTDRDSIMLEFGSHEQNVIKLDASMMDSVRSKLKTATLRKGLRNYITGAGALVNSSNHNDIIFITITKIKTLKLSEITSDIVQEEGFSSIEELRADMLRFYPDLTAESELTYVQFELDHAFRD